MPGEEHPSLLLWVVAIASGSGATAPDDAPDGTDDDEDDSDDCQPDEAFDHEPEHAKDEAEDEQENNYSNHVFDATLVNFPAKPVDFQEI
ncbi:MAG: hypothetical protein JWR36_2254 [Glaciihabitans sp.]|nr:hypothetical protein [Glaciihabitans sp.]MDQ1571814.1 hypothetical protein [Actinomycetota bacterium]